MNFFCRNSKTHISPLNKALLSGEKFVQKRIQTLLNVIFQFVKVMLKLRSTFLTTFDLSLSVCLCLCLSSAVCDICVSLTACLSMPVYVCSAECLSVCLSMCVLCGWLYRFASAHMCLCMRYFVCSSVPVYLTVCQIDRYRLRETWKKRDWWRGNETMDVCYLFHLSLYLLLFFTLYSLLYRPA